MMKIGMASKIEGYEDWLVADGVMSFEKFMYAAASGEDIVPTSCHLFCLTKSSTNLLPVSDAKREEHGSAQLTSGSDGNSFRLRNDGVQNRYTTSKKHFMNLESKKDRSAEKVECTLLSITESVHWAMGLPFVITNMSFIYIQNVQSEDQFVRI